MPFFLSDLTGLQRSTRLCTKQDLLTAVQKLKNTLSINAQRIGLVLVRFAIFVQAENLNRYLEPRIDRVSLLTSC